MMSKKAVVLSLIALLAITQIVNAHEGHSHDDDEDEEGGEDHVLVLTTKNFDETIAAHKFILVEFYAPWCGHCKSLAPEYAKAADILKGEEVKLAKVDATEESSLGERFNVKGYPTLKFFRDGKASEYNGGRTASEIVAWLRKKTGPAAKPIADAAALQAFQSSADAVVVGYFAQDGADKDAFLAAAAANDDLSFGLVSDASVSADAKFPSVVVYKTFDEKRNDFTGPFTADEITAFTGASSVPLVMEFNDDNVKKIFGSKIANKALFFIDYDAADYKSQLEQYRSVAETHKGKAVFATVNKDKSQVLEYFGLEEKNLPVFFMLKMSEDNDMKKYKHEGTVSDLSSFITSYLAGNVKPFLKSEPIPTGDNGESVRTLVGLNFNTVVFDETKDVLVEFYAPWCGHCKSLAPKYEKLAKKFSSVSSIVIAKIDSTANDVENVEVSGFPTIKFWPAGKKDKAIDYDGARTVKGLTKFLKEHATVKFDLQEKKADDEGKEDL